MKPLLSIFVLTFLLTACSQSDELTFDEQAAIDKIEADANRELYEAKQAEDEKKFATMEPTDEDGDGYKTFTAAEYGVSFDFPSDWFFELDSFGTAGYRVDLSNEAREDACTDSLAQLVFTFPMQKDAATSFKTFVESPEIYDLNGGMGQLGGVLTETTLAGRTAFTAESSGYESIRCEDEATVVEMDDSSYMFIGLFTGEVGNEATEVQNILNSLSID